MKKLFAFEGQSMEKIIPLLLHAAIIWEIDIPNLGRSKRH